MTSCRAVAAAIIVLAASGGLGGVAAAQDFSGKPIRIIVGLAPGGGTDVTARLIAQRLSADLGTNVYIENKAGGAFEPAYRELVNAAPDGHTLFFISTATVSRSPRPRIIRSTCAR
jgi:tripartite-type tricarboxylate transporter receptor subunit TctC